VLKARQILSESEYDSVVLCEEGVGGTYFIQENNCKIAVFKPTDEEPGAANNPKKNTFETSFTSWRRV